MSKSNLLGKYMIGHIYTSPDDRIAKTNNLCLFDKHVEVILHCKALKVE